MRDFTGDCAFAVCRYKCLSLEEREILGNWPVLSRHYVFLNDFINSLEMMLLWTTCQTALLIWSTPSNQHPSFLSLSLQTQPANLFALLYINWWSFNLLSALFFQVIHRSIALFIYHNIKSTPVHMLDSYPIPHSNGTANV